MKQQHQQSGIIAWFAGNSVAANLLMLIIIVLGILSIGNLRKEAFPSRAADTITVAVTYDSGDAQLSEVGIAIKIEEALEDLTGIKRVTSVSNSNGSTVSVEMKSTADLDDLLRDVKNKVDAIYNFPSEAEKPVIEKQQRLSQAYSIKIYGDSDRATLQKLATRLKADLLAQNEISIVSINGEADLQLSIEIDEAQLQAYGLSLSDINTAINAESSSAVSTSLRNESKVIQLKASEQAYYTQSFAKIPLITTGDGSIIRLGDIANINDSFADSSFVLSRYNGLNGIGLELKVDEAGDVIKIVEQADKIVASWQTNPALPKGVSIEAWNDGSQLISDRLAMLIKNAISGIALVFLVLALFLNLRVAIWVTAGLPFIFCGTLFFMTDNFTGMTINEMTTFGFILALGIVVDDAIVVGESIYDTRLREGDSLESTIKGTLKVASPTIFGMLTTIATFIALSNVEGGMGQVYAQFAIIVTICLLLSLVESKLILPSHLAHLDTHQKIGTGWRDSWGRIQRACNQGLDWVNKSLYVPTIQKAITYRYAAVFIFISLFVLVISMPFNGTVRIAFFPSIPGSVVEASITMQNDASYGLTRDNLLILEDMAYDTDVELRNSTAESTSLITTVEVIASNDYSGGVTLELASDVPYSLNEFANRWKQKVGTLEGVKNLNIRSGFGRSDNFKVELKAWDDQTLQLAGQKFREALIAVNGVQGLDDNFNAGVSQIKFNLTPEGSALGMTTAQLSTQLLQAFGGEVVQSYQRGKDEVKVRVRYPEESRQSVDDVLNARVRTPSGNIVPLSSVATVTSGYQQNDRTRISGLPAYYVSASVDKEIISSNELVALMQQNLVPQLLETYPDLSINFAGEAEEQAETAGSMVQLFIIAMLAIYILLAIPLRSYVQPMIIMTAIPFGLVGAILGHWMNDMTLSILSFNGIVALSGVVVNDSLLLVSRFNTNLKNDMNVKDSLFEACTGRLRAVLLTSFTTFAGLLPLLSETSAQAQFIIPAAASLGYGILFATFITLILIPSLIMIQHDIINIYHKLANNKILLETDLE